MSSMETAMPRPSRVILAASAIGALAALGCSSQGAGDCIGGEENCARVETEVVPSSETPGPTCTEIGARYVGLGGVTLNADRIDGYRNADRGRMKPYEVLSTEYARVLGESSAPVLITQTGSTFGSSPARWAAEPLPNAVSLYTSFRVGFEACLRTTGGIPVDGVTPPPEYATAPTATTAPARCEAWAHTFWNRRPSPDEVDACVAVALGSVEETIPDNGELKTLETSPQRRWAYACATLLTTTGFLSY